MRFKRIYIEITNVCNLQCSFCPPHHRENRFMTEEKFETILAKIKPYTHYIYLHVKGEPLLHPSVDTLIQKAYQEGFFIHLTTNGTLLSEHLSITKYLRQINLSVHATNRKDIIETAKGIHNCIVNYRIWNKSYNHEAIALLEDIYQVKISDTPQFTLAPQQFVSQEELFEWPDSHSSLQSEKGYCHALTSQIAILVDGTVVPCCLDHKGEMPLGNIFTNSLEEILNSQRVQKMIDGFRQRKVTEFLCKKCTYKDRF